MRPQIRRGLTSAHAAIALRVPVAVEVIPVLRLRADARAQLVGELLRRRPDRFVARASRLTTIGAPGRTVKRPGRSALDEAGQQRRAGHEPISAGVRRNQARRPRNCTATRSRPRCRSISMATMSVVREAAADLQRRVERLSDLDRVGAEPLADVAPDPVDLRVRLRHRDDGQRHACTTRRMKTPPDLPVAVVAGDEDDARGPWPADRRTAARPRAVVEQRLAARRRGARSARMKSMTSLA